MTKDIPHIIFNPATTENFGFEILPIEKIAREKGKYNHNPELPHQLKFYNLIFFTSGFGRHFIDFNWFPVQENSLVYLTKEQVNAFDFSKDLNGFCIIFTEEYFVKCFSNLSKDYFLQFFKFQNKRISKLISSYYNKNLITQNHSIRKLLLNPYL